MRVRSDHPIMEAHVGAHSYTIALWEFGRPALVAVVQTAHLSYGDHDSQFRRLQGAAGPACR